VEIHDILPPAMPSWGLLRALRLEEMGIQSLPISVAKALQALTDLSLANNNLTEMPSTVALITTLQTLNLKGNYYLELKCADIDTLAHLLPSFRRLDLTKPYQRPPLQPVGNPQRRGRMVAIRRVVRQKDEEKWERTVSILQAINKLKPEIHLPGFYIL
jgi:Leucine-rich repeat (LRR) protein